MQRLRSTVPLNGDGRESTVSLGKVLSTAKTQTTGGRDGTATRPLRST